ncbi:MAG: GatB/YqeY domain-containing protein [Candidatus Liptonbacteria bacterium]|nr:GatB/YqeY domain-containing protein [Candidatus Liptonbacteria bacterium]
MLKDKLAEDLKCAMKAGDAERVSTLRMLSAALQNRAIEKRGTGQGAGLSDEDVLAVLEKEAKKRREAAELYRKGGRNDLAEHELREVSLIAVYLPVQASDEEIQEVLARLIREGAGDFASLMKGAMRELKGKADGARVGALAKKALESR